ncbi:hypothetical protein [Sphingobium yanoikuyae]|uniref:hypothetical protein n=1 Tax=Sphingobium yanoikuyae TaxID=13690 RepID=UPI003F05619F
MEGKKMDKDRFGYLAIWSSVLTLLAGCDGSVTNQSEQVSGRASVSNTVSNVAGAKKESAPYARPEEAANAGAADVPGSEMRYCRFEVEGKVHVNEKCEVYPMGDGGYTLNAWSSGKPENSHFAVVIVDGEGKGDASWNADPDDDKAMDSLGTVTFEEGCWVNKRTRICAR